MVSYNLKFQAEGVLPHQLLQRVRIARNAERSNSQRDSVCPSVTFRYCVQTNEGLNEWKDNWKLFFLRTHFLSFSFILIVYRVLDAFSLNATLILIN